MVAFKAYPFTSYIYNQHITNITNSGCVRPIQVSCFRFYNFSVMAMLLHLFSYVAPSNSNLKPQIGDPVRGFIILISLLAFYILSLLNCLIRL